jgi:hypothetical protein
MRVRFWLTAGAIFGLFSLDAALASSAYTCTLVQYPSAINTYIGSINNRGQAVGTWRDPSGADHGFLRSADGVFTKLTAPSGEDAFPVGINNLGQVLTSSTMVPDYFSPASTYIINPDGTYVDIAPPEVPAGYVYTASTFTGINDKGELAGFIIADLRTVSPAYGTIFVFIRSADGQYRIVDQSGTGSSLSLTTGPINNADVIVEYDRGTQGHLLQPDGSRVPLVAPGLLYTATVGGGAVTTGLNNNQLTTGYFGAVEARGSFLRTSDGHFTSITCPELLPDQPIFPTALNDYNVVAGYTGAPLASGEIGLLGFIATPTDTVPHMVICQPNVTFNMPVPGSAFPIARIWVGNTGPADLHITTVYLGGRGVSSEPLYSFRILDTNCAYAASASMPVPFLPPWGDCYVDILFAPQGPGLHTNSLYVIGDSPDSPQIVQLSGIGQMDTF